MKKLQLLIILLVIFNLQIKSQTDSLSTISYSADIRVSSISDAQKSIDNFISSKKIIPSIYYKTKSTIEININISEQDYLDLKSLIPKWGYLDNHQETTTNYIEKMNDLKLEQNSLINEKGRYIKLSENIDASNSKYYDYSEKIIKLEKEIGNLNYEILHLKKKHKNFNVNLKFIEETNTTYSNDISWVNMPGIEYSYLISENSTLNISPDKMNGYILKYMFTRGKSYGLLGLYRANTTDSLTINDMYIFGLGQDFYSKHLGRGENKFFNLYISFNAGVYVTSNKIKLVNSSWFVNPFFGLEILKTKNLLFDSKIGYFLPFETNKTQRGFLANFSFNFVF
ncbi:MAG: hypothetical protein JXR51_01185 [Bacteroidales bacterium]|nr:hypothetical protein [Bacteroidales bacterium]MBN2755757.1 hypothetical protein [Bacteroidales bacterium]